MDRAGRLSPSPSITVESFQENSGQLRRIIPGHETREVPKTVLSGISHNMNLYVVIRSMQSEEPRKC